ncbi:MAG: hypothetical protein ABIB46_02910, partial [bacterium]
TTASIAKRLKRNFITIEISKEYHEVILKRLDGKISEIKRNKKVESEKQEILFDLVNLNNIHKTYNIIKKK